MRSEMIKAVMSRKLNMDK